MLKRTLSTTAAAAIALTIFGCSLADSPTGPQSLPPSAASNSLLGTVTGVVTGAVSTVTNLASTLLVSCDRLPTQSVSQTVGPLGGRINVGPHSISIPAGALKSNVRITAEITGDRASSVRFSPEGLRFQKPATLTMSYAHCRKLLPLPTRVVYTTDNLRVLELLRSLDNRSEKKVYAPLDHFSKYAVAYRDEDDSEEGFTTEQPVY